MARVLIREEPAVAGRHFVHHFLECGDDVVVVVPTVQGTGGSTRATDGRCSNLVLFPGSHFGDATVETGLGRRPGSL